MNFFTFFFFARKKTQKMSQSLAALRAYVCAPGQAGGANQAESTVRLNVEHVALKATRFAELRLDKHVRRKKTKRKKRDRV